MRTDVRAPIDVERAKSQHQAYIEALRDQGRGSRVCDPRAFSATSHIAVSHIDSDPNAPDCCFVEDTAVLWDGGGVITRMAAPSRVREGAPVAAALAAAHLKLEPMVAPATLDGGDVLRVGTHLLVGMSARTNDAGVAALATLAASFGLAVTPIRVHAGLHLKSALTLLDPDTLLLGHGIDPEPLKRLGMRLLHVNEPHGANVLPLGHTVLVSSAAPATAEMLAKRGVAVRLLDVSELHAGDGGLTCLSLRQPHPGGWCA